ncbi:MAG: hypothetical protein Q9181_006603 [Wetmoreana brouardii]
MDAEASPNVISPPPPCDHRRTQSNEHSIAKQYEIPPPEPIASSTALKDRIRYHYEIASDYYYTLWGEHIHHGYFLEPTDTKERAQTRLIQLLLDRAQLPKGSTVLDVGCGLGGTSRYLARHRHCHVTGITISGKQVELALRLTAEEAAVDAAKSASGGSIKLGQGSARFVELDAERLADYFPTGGVFDCVWITEAMSHLPDKKLFFQNAAKLLGPQGRLVVADWFKAEDLTIAQLEADIKPIEAKILAQEDMKCERIHHRSQEQFSSRVFEVLSNGDLRSTPTTPSVPILPNFV